MTPHEFITEWRASALKERSASQDLGDRVVPGTILMLTPFAGLPYDFQMLETLRDQFPDADPVHLAALGDIWSVEVSKIVERMLRIAKDRGVSGLPVLARPEASFQLANLVLMLQGQVIKRKTARTSIQTIDAEAERDALTSPLIQDRIENTAIILAEHVWLPLCNRWWNRFPMILLEKLCPQDEAAVQRGVHPLADDDKNENDDQVNEAR